jgi:anti-sigma factor RsiW
VTGVFDDHLSLDVVVAYADGEMSLTAYQRAAAHLVRCGACAADVAEQTAASQYLRAAQMPTMPGSLFDALKSIPVASPAPSSPGGSYPTTSDHSGPGPGRGRRFRLGAGALVAGIAVGAVMVTAAGDSPTDPAAPPRPERTAVSPTFPAPSGALRTTVINVLGRSSTTTR